MLLSAIKVQICALTGRDTCRPKIFGRLSAWQNWVFLRDDATGPEGALMSYGEGLVRSLIIERC